MSDVQDLKNGNQDAFNEIYSRYHRQLYYYILHRTNAYYAEEVVQLTFIKLWDRRKKLSEEIELHIQLFRIARTTLIDQLRKNKNKKAIKTRATVRYINSEVVDLMDYKETASKLKTMVESLPPMRRKVFEMSRFEAMTHREISEELNITPKTVENHINLALKYMRKSFLNLSIIFLL